MAEPGKLRTPMINSRTIDGPEDAVGNVCRSRNLQKMSAGSVANGRTIHITRIADRGNRRHPEEEQDAQIRWQTSRSDCMQKCKNILIKDVSQLF